MKPCPFCKANIDDNARFCVYCMTSLDEKTVIPATQQRNIRPLILLSLIAVVCFLVAVYAGWQLSDAKQTPAVSPVATTTVYVSTTTAPQTSTDDTTEPSASFVSSTTENATTSVESDRSPSYVYRPVESGDEFIAVGIPRPENGITIVEVETPAENGIYDIPAYIDGKPVLAIDEYAFCAASIAPTVKAVYFPETMTTVNEYAFISCTNLTDVYYRSNIYIRGYAYPDQTHRSGALTVHCAADCHNRNFRLHKDLVDEAENTYFEEWNGET